MPNHVTTVMLMSPEIVQAFTFVNGLGETIVDFEMVIPEPDRIYHGGCDGKHPHPHPDGGFYDYCWYEWNVENWGTKWNAYDAKVTPAAGDLVEVRFDTAWSHPYPVIEALSLKFPEEPITVVFADEDLGCNLGSYEILNGEVTIDLFPVVGSDAALDMAAQVKYGMPYKDMQAEWGVED
jgi:hypothetical protein